MDSRETPSSKSSGESLGTDIFINPQPSTSADAEILESNYAELAQARSKEPLVISMDRNLYSTIPKRCIVPVSMVESKKEYDENLSNYIVRKSTVITEFYISSKEVAKYFVHVEFPRRIGPVLGFTAEELKSAEKMMATIYLQSERAGYLVNYEVTTVLDIQWPKFCTLHWLHRKPGQIKDKVNHIIYEWPSRTLKDLIQTFKCVVIPRGFLQKYGTNKQRDLEWEIAYPRVEKYLQTTMSHAQLKTYFLLVLLHKSFIEPVTKHRGIISDHIKMIMYWEIERNFLHWPETRMGRKLKQILMRLEMSLSRGRQQHYFHHHKNIFGNIPLKQLYDAQTIINNIVQNPVPYVISALRNLQYSNPGNFYSMFDYEELYHQLRGEDIIARPAQKVAGRNVTFSKADHDKKKPELNKQESVDLVDLTWFCKIDPKDTIRRKNILVMFIKHFIEIGKQSSMRMITDQALLYLQHAMDLTTILDQENHLHKVEVDQFMRLIETEQSRVRHSVPSEFSTDPMESPALPLRTSTLRPTSA